MSANKYPHLFEPIIVANTVFRNRIFASPTGSSYVDIQELPMPEIAAYYERKAIGGAASVAMGERAVDNKRGLNYGGNPIPVGDHRGTSFFRYVTNAISRHGAIASIDYEKCTHCGKCVEKCPRKIIVFEEGKAKIEEPKPEASVKETEDKAAAEKPVADPKAEIAEPVKPAQEPEKAPTAEAVSAETKVEESKAEENTVEETPAEEAAASESKDAPAEIPAEDSEKAEDASDETK